jgi:hypothetical protein
MRNFPPTRRNKIQVTKEEAIEKVSEWEMINQKLKSELKEATQQLISKTNELTSSKAELLKHRQEIDVRKKIAGKFVEILIFSFLPSDSDSTKTSATSAHCAVKRRKRLTKLRFSMH